MPVCLHPHSDKPQGQGAGGTAPSTWAAASVACVEGPQQHMPPTCRARRAAKEAKEAPAQPAPEKVKVEVKKFVKIGRPGYKGESVPGTPALSHTCCSWT